MASQEHLAMLDDDDSSTTTTSNGSDDDEETSSENGEVVAPSEIIKPTEAADGDEDDGANDAVSSTPAKKRIKLSLGGTKEAPKGTSTEKKIQNGGKAVERPPKSLSTRPKPSTARRSLPIKKKVQLNVASLRQGSTEGTDWADDGEIKAMVVDSDDGEEDDAVAAVVEEPTSNKQPVEVAKRKLPAAPAARSLRLPPMNSPGLLIPAVSGVFKGTADANGLCTPASVFDYAMSLAGYTTEGRTKRPHRGSSVQRVVGDKFDSDVKFTLNFPALVPKDLLQKPEPGRAESNGDIQRSLPERLIRAFRSRPSQPATSSSNGGTSLSNGSRKRRKLATFKDIAPLSLTIPYPESYLRKRLEYVGKVNEREKAIIDYQESVETLEIEKERLESKGKSVDESFTKPQIVIPPIPEPPSPPRLRELAGFDPEKFEDQHPQYFPKGQEELVAHLDKACFHIVDGRYFGLLTNCIADPHFIGANAPGVGGLSLTGGTGLATANSGGGGASVGATLLSAPSQSGASVNADAPKGPSASSTKPPAKKPGAPPSTTSITTPNGAKSEKSKSTSGSKKKGNGLKVTASFSNLRKIMEDGGDLAEKMKVCIIRSAVHASRSGRHGQAFRAPNGHTYGDVSKAFAAHAGVKPCNRCKNNKQGAYHCRLRRKHKELDFDGTNSPEVLAPLLSVPMDELLWKPEK